MDGLLIVDKPAGPTSHDVVARLRQVLKERRIGHTGTLDPAASGVLALVLGRATRLAQFLSAGDKTYEATVRLGSSTDTYDALGEPTGEPHRGPLPARAEIERALDAFRGTFLQRPPAFSAKMIDGTRSYKIARAARRDSQAALPNVNPAKAGSAVLPDPVSVTTRTIEIVDVEADRLKLRIVCAPGFYVRALAHDLGERLGTGAHLETLVRTRSGDATIEDAVPFGRIERDPAAAAAALIPLERLLPSLTAVVLTDLGVRHARNGCDLGPRDQAGGLTPFESSTPRAEHSTTVRLLDLRGELVGIAAPARTPGLLHPAVILV